MTKLATAIFTAVLSTTFAAGALASDIQVKAEHNGPSTVFRVTKAGEPLANYPVEISGIDADQNMTSDNGSVYLRPDVLSPRKVTLTVIDDNGESVSESTLVTVDR
ncbi:hypothetical protein SAMN04488136_101208 [Vibrio xiamenensis]|uniref:Uncharacterized protein n=1 Tax=Vibrio xiamenensis TaxID=861298 RepID=A0A1G7W669_9VIBR|nr:hypothetical protein [Vibrio xiamenensis]SDG67448.1 hypothetical protein SAMN04488136_101208 [Vibrio xiamenensis]